MVRGDTFLIRDKYNHPYALKLSKNFNEDELEALKHFSTPDCHHNLICYKDDFMFNEYFALLTDYIDGNTLDFTYGLTNKDLELIFLELLNILAYIHSKGYVHKDPNLSNIMITKQGKVKLIDFGNCRPISKLYDIGGDLFYLASSISEKLPDPPRPCLEHIFKTLGYHGKRGSFEYKYTISANEAADLMIKCITNQLKIEDTVSIKNTTDMSLLRQSASKKIFYSISSSSDSSDSFI